MSDKYDDCPLKDAGLFMVHLSELPAIIIGSDNKCICTKDQRCLDVDKRDGMRCTLDQLKQLSAEAVSRRARQSGDDW